MAILVKMYVYKHQGYNSRFCQKWGFEVSNGMEQFYVGMYVYMS